MKISCSWTLDRLSDHLDGALDARDRDLVESHLGGCPECSAILDDLREIALAAARLPNREPITDLWGGIATRIGAAAPATGTMMRRFSLSVMQLVAAGIALILFTSAVVWLVRPNAAGDREVAAVAQPGTGGAFSYVARAVAPGSDAAIAELELLLEQARDQLDPATVQVLETNLAIIDRAIEDARRALAEDPANAYLSEHLAQQVRRKVNLLRHATDIVRGQS